MTRNKLKAGREKRRWHKRKGRIREKELKKTKFKKHNI